MRVCIDQDLCTGDGLCETVAESAFYMGGDGLAYVQERAKEFGTEVVFSPMHGNMGGPDDAARVAVGWEDAVIEAAEGCPGECILIEAD